MKIIAVDDEPKALQDLWYELEKTGIIPMEAVRTFTSPFKAYEYAKTHTIDLAFIDISLPGISGLEVAKAIRQLKPDSQVIFLTAYSEYTLEAFRVRAFGYLLKPVTSADLRRELEDFFKEHSGGDGFFAQCFGRFGFFSQHSPVIFEREKSRELLAYLIDQRGAFVTQPELVDVLWEGRVNSPALRSQLRNIIFFLRKSLAAYRAEHILLSRRNELAVDTAAFTCDYYDFLKGDERAMAQFQGAYMFSYSWGEETTATLVALKNAVSPCKAGAGSK